VSKSGLEYRISGKKLRYEPATEATVKLAKRVLEMAPLAAKEIDQSLRVLFLLS
jgi:hypothetical protein